MEENEEVVSVETEELPEELDGVESEELPEEDSFEDTLDEDDDYEADVEEDDSSEDLEELFRQNPLRAIFLLLLEIRDGN